MSDAIATLLANGGPVGIMCLYLIWRQERDTKACASERRERLEADRERTETDKQLAGALATLAELIRTRRP